MQPQPSQGEVSSLRPSHHLNYLKLSQLPLSPGAQIRVWNQQSHPHQVEGFQFPVPPPSETPFKQIRVMEGTIKPSPPPVPSSSPPSELPQKQIRVPEQVNHPPPPVPPHHLNSLKQSTVPIVPPGAPNKGDFKNKVNGTSNLTPPTSPQFRPLSPMELTNKGMEPATLHPQPGDVFPVPSSSHQLKLPSKHSPSSHCPQPGAQIKGMETRQNLNPHQELKIKGYGKPSNLTKPPPPGEVSQSQSLTPPIWKLPQNSPQVPPSGSQGVHKIKGNGTSKPHPPTRWGFPGFQSPVPPHPSELPQTVNSSHCFPGAQNKGIGKPATPHLPQPGEVFQSLVPSQHHMNLPKPQTSQFPLYPMEVIQIRVMEPATSPPPGEVSSPSPSHHLNSLKQSQFPLSPGAQNTRVMETPATSPPPGEVFPVPSPLTHHLEPPSNSHSSHCPPGAQNKGMEPATSPPPRVGGSTSPTSPSHHILNSLQTVTVSHCSPSPPEELK
ncbi:uncharacterized protein LOC135216311 [Macrobrachium nipponense]|uniref:uncharacterized protein LOC135216311 n=1 Tax=Macrobrachium nipponense TaxID=159736 RepID=UPI0030C7B5B9